jgi:hypothetical protein
MSRAWRAGVVLIAAVCAAPLFAADKKPVDPQTGLAIDQGVDIVKSWCTTCHSAQLITRSTKTRAAWVDTIRWMQSTQGLWDLGEREGEILDYLSRNYGAPAAGAGPSRAPTIPLPPPR